MAKRDLPEINLPSNNIQEPNTPKGVVQVTTKPKRRSSRFANEVRGISSYLYSDVILPALKGIISDFVTNGIDMILHGDQQTTYRRGGRRNYGAMSNRRVSGVGRYGARPSKRKYEGAMMEEIFFGSRQDAELTLAKMLEYVAEYGWCSIGDLYSLVGLTSNHTHERYGWDAIGRTRVLSTPDGYILDLPEPEYFS